jgi:hypothetical protein
MLHIQAISDFGDTTSGTVKIDRYANMFIDRDLTVGTNGGNVALKNFDNNFTVTQTIDAPHPTLTLKSAANIPTLAYLDNTAPVDSRRWLLYSMGGVFKFESTTDSGTGQSFPLQLQRNGNINVANQITANGAIISNAADGFFVKSSVGFTRMHLRNLNEPANLQTYVLLNYAQKLYICPANDEGNLTNFEDGDWSRAITIQRDGAVVTGSGGLYVNRVPEGATDRQLTYGVYTPTGANLGNVNSATWYPANFSRVGNWVTVTSRVDIYPAAAGYAALSVSLPIGLIIPAYGYSWGTFAGQGFCGWIDYHTQAYVKINFTPAGAGTYSGVFTFVYQMAT